MRESQKKVGRAPLVVTRPILNDPWFYAGILAGLVLLAGGVALGAIYG